MRERAEALRQSIGKQAIEFGIRQFHVTASAGLAQLTPGMTIAQWIEEADRVCMQPRTAAAIALPARGAANERITRTAIESTQAPAQQPIVAAAVIRRPSGRGSFGQLAAEAFTDTNFVPNIARRIAEWRRGWRNAHGRIAAARRSAARRSIERQRRDAVAHPHGPASRSAVRA